MFHKAAGLQFKDGTTLEVLFQDGTTKRYDMASLFDACPQLKALENRQLFLAGQLSGYYGIRWNDELDVDTETIYEEGETVCVQQRHRLAIAVGNAVAHARAEKSLSQTQLAARTGIDQSDLSKIERGVANPSLLTLSRIAQALDCTLQVKFDPVQPASRTEPEQRSLKD